MTEEASSVPFLEWGVASKPLAGQSESGDQYVLERFAEGALLGVIDGLGHGDEAARAARTAVSLLRQHPQDPLVTLLRRCHEALKQTRGAVISLASFHVPDNTMTWLGVGNVEGVLLRTERTESGQRRANENIMLYAGLLGMQLPNVRPSVVPLAPGDTLILTTDGIRNDFTRQLVLSDRPQQIADRICTRFAKGTDDALVLVARYMGR